MDNSQKMVDLLQEIKTELQYINVSTSVLSSIEDLLAGILEELRKSWVLWFWL